MADEVQTEIKIIDIWSYRLAVTGNVIVPKIYDN